MQVALGHDTHIDERMSGKLLQHVIEEADTGGDVELANAVQIDGNGNARFLGRALDACLAGAFCSHKLSSFNSLEAF